LAGGEAKIEAFLTDLAVRRKVVPAPQNQAMNALVFLYKQVLKMPLGEAINAVRADRKVNVPVVLTREEVARVIPLVEGKMIGVIAKNILALVPAGGDVIPPAGPFDAQRLCHEPIRTSGSPPCQVPICPNDKM
jgi:hypothetical protein